ncbi:uncharacterized protein LOC129942471 isoform X2 [Eupeodes corollae]|uniref:uncharacterized protein LOC129942471 isoform X2 n=1 Tax=Eupeodes corollae TaxID=290404 RepID=UPI00248F5A6B|nr:uncharacterized protein LOC129942471 isoform X2 [Eupeodes corollae]
MAFIHLIYFYIVILSFLINPKEVILHYLHERNQVRAREADIPLPFATSSSSSSSSTSSSSPAISAVLLECPNVQRRRATSRPTPDCERQMMVHIRVSPSFQVEKLDKFLLLDEVYDQRRKTRAKLMSPYLIEISRGEPVIMYPLQFSKSIRCGTCGHKIGNNTNTSSCKHPVDAAIHVPLTASAISHSGASSAEVAPVSGIHVLQSVQQENQQQKQQQQHNAINEAPLGSGHNNLAATAAAAAAAAVAGPKPSSEKIESRQKLAIGILDSPHFGEANKQANSVDDEDDDDFVVHEMGFSSRDTPLRIVQDNDDGNIDLDYDIVDEYDELNLNDGGGKKDGGLFSQNSLRDKRLKKQPSSPSWSRSQTQQQTQSRPLPLARTRSSLSSLNVAVAVSDADADALLGNEKLFRRAERQGEEARMETLRAFTRKNVHEQPFGIGVVGPAPVDGATSASSWVNVGKPHVVGIQEDCIRPQGTFDADEIDDVETDADVDGDGDGNDGKVGYSDERQKQVPRLQQKAFVFKNGHRFTVTADMQGSQSNKATQNRNPGVNFDNHLKTNLNSNKESGASHQGYKSNSNRVEEGAFLLASSKPMPLGSHSHGSFLQNDQQKLRFQEKPDDVSIKDISPNTKFPFTKSKDSYSNVNTQHIGDASGSSSSNTDDDGDGDVVSNEDYDRIDSSARDSLAIDSTKSNIPTAPIKTTMMKTRTNPDDIETAAGGMGDEFYWNTLHYPKSRSSSTSSTNTNTNTNVKIHEGHNSPGKLSNNVKPKGGTRNTSKDFGRTAQIQKWRNYNDHRRHQTNSTSRTPSKKDSKPADDKNAGSPSRHPINDHDDAKGVDRAVGKRREKFLDKSAMARNRMKIRSSALETDSGVVETSGMYSAKDGIVPAFPLNGYPGYGDLKIVPHLTPLDHSKSQYSVLENEPQEYVPHQPPYAKELSDPNLTLQEKIDLLEVLQDDGEVKDEILRNLENELDTSVIVHDITNHDRMPIPSIRITRKRARNGGIRKRSYLTYDDLTMRDTDEQYDDMNEKQFFDVPRFNDDERNYAKSEKCHLCSGNMCPASRDGSSCNCDRNGRHCECSRKKPKKKIRSVSDAWYSVFNMSAPLQFLTTRVGIYRKRHGTWWKTAPSITLTSLSGIYASENLSILFSSHVDIFQLKRPLTLQNHKLLIPQVVDDSDEVKAEHRNPYDSINPSDVLAIDSSMFDFNKIHDDSDTNNKEDDQSNEDEAAAAAAAKITLCHASELQRNRRRSTDSHPTDNETDGVLSIGDLGYFPADMNILEQCPTDPNHLCLNVLDEEAPAFTIKIKQPFLENALLYSGEYRVRIASIITDATTKGALQVAVVVINEDSVAHEFSICICDCPKTCGSRTTVKKNLSPHISETASFLLPLEETKNTKLYCNVQPTARCLCIWDCDCHCIQDLVSHVDYDVCQKLGDYEEQEAGFIEGGVLDGQNLTGWRWFWWRMNYYAFSLLLCMLFLGLLKAVVGALCLRRFDRCGYDYVQPLRKYDYASRCRRFFINIVFFVVLPFICCCNCFIPNEEDLLVGTTEWQCSLIQHDFYKDNSDDGDSDGGGGGGAADGIWKKPLGLYCDNDGYGQNAIDNNDDDDEETILRLSQSFESVGTGRGSRLDGSQSRVSISELLLKTCEYDDDEEERDMNYVLNALSESQESIKMLLKSHRSEKDLDMANPLTASAEDLVRQLVAAKIVYRTFATPLYSVDVSPGQKYSIQGYFVPSFDSSYQFIATNPLLQQRRITTTTTTTTATPAAGYISDNLEPPNILRAEDFQRAYKNKLEVLKAGDLSVAPPVDAPCINSSHTSNESQLTAEAAAELTSPAMSSHPLQVLSAAPLSPMYRREPIDNDEVNEHGPATANDTITRSDRVDDANNGSNLQLQQKGPPI